MKPFFNVRRAFTVSAFFLALTAISCEVKESSSLAREVLITEDEAFLDAAYEDIDDLVMEGLLAVIDAQGGRIADSPADHRFCDGVFSFQGNESEGSFIIDFGSSCIDNNENERQGRLEVDYSSEPFLPGFRATVAINNYGINDVVYNGTRVLASSDESTKERPVFTIIMQNGEATWPNASVLTQQVDLVRVWHRSEDRVQDTLRVTGTATGKIRGGEEVSIIIADTLVFALDCSFSNTTTIPVAGTKILTLQNDELTIDYGQGDCDRLVEVAGSEFADEIMIF